MEFTPFQFIDHVVLKHSTPPLFRTFPPAGASNPTISNNYLLIWLYMTATITSSSPTITSALELLLLTLKTKNS
ncbi:hypothetical protein L596_025570 [Steinernema carpocapsae]|uniref:Uncharacterized protein n=1 Tax=Steinernema carpocapsae TaxID=34508 RepID=A0A4U5M859_STECR|nr:hypothetical protein L596_025570 [Steinernema carpocapsae]